MNLYKNVKKYKFDKVFIFNSSLRYNLITRLSGIKEIYQYPLFKKKNQHIINPAIELVKKNFPINEAVEPKAMKTKEKPRVKKIVLITTWLLFFSTSSSNEVPEM